MKEDFIEVKKPKKWLKIYLIIIGFMVGVLLGLAVQVYRNINMVRDMTISGVETVNIK